MLSVSLDYSVCLCPVRDTGNIEDTRHRAKTNKTQICNITQKTKKDEQYGLHQKPGVNPGACEG
jgi:hypothetical protein